MNKKELKNAQKRLSKLYELLWEELGSSEMDLVGEVVELEIELSKEEGM